MYGLLSCRHPFIKKEDTQKETLEKNREAAVEFDPEIWDKISEEAKDLLMRLIEKDPKQRLSAIDALKHPWFVCDEEASVTPSMLDASDNTPS